MKVTQSCTTFGNCTGHGILQARILEWVAFPFSRGSSQPGGFLHCRQILYQLSHQGSRLISKGHRTKLQFQFSEANVLRKGSQEAICLKFGGVEGNIDGLLDPYRVFLSSILLKGRPGLVTCHLQIEQSGSDRCHIETKLSRTVTSLLGARSFSGLCRLAPRNPVAVLEAALWRSPCR